VCAIIFFHRNFIQNEQLRKELGLLRQKLNDRQELVLENTRLRNLLSLKERVSYRVIASRVIGRPLDNWSEVIIIDKGRLQGIRSGMVVVNYSGLLGRVTETTEFTSKITLLNNPNFSVSAMVQRSRQEGLVVGGLGDYLSIRYLPLEADVKVSDAIITSGLTELFPKGLLIGRVRDVREDSLGLSRYAVIEPAVNLSGIDEVLVIVP
jgi:rod shape-determining protein MreC